MVGSVISQVQHLGNTVHQIWPHVSNKAIKTSSTLPHSLSSDKSEHSPPFKCLLQDVRVETGLFKGVGTAVSEIPLWAWVSLCPFHFAATGHKERPYLNPSCVRVAHTLHLSRLPPGQSGCSGRMVERCHGAVIVSKSTRFCPPVLMNVCNVS